jgi:hypothetical protein
MKPCTPLFSIILLSLTIIGCSKTEKMPLAVETHSLSMDSNFIKVVQLEQNLSDFIFALANQKGLTPNEFKNKIQSLRDKDLHSNSNNSNVNDYIGADNVAYLNDFAQNYRVRWSKINANYTYIPVQKLQEACQQIYTQQYNLKAVMPVGSATTTTLSLVGINKAGDCGWKYYLCMAAATSAGILCHGNCIGLTAGFGTPGCVILCGTLQTAAGVACIDNFCPIP